MKPLALLAVLVLAAGSVRADDSASYAPKEAPHVDIISPNVVQTWAYFSFQDRQFQWNPDTQTFTANIIFSTAPYQDDNNPIERQNAIFPFPGVTYDAASSTFSATNPQGQVIPLATGGPGATGNIQLLPTSRVSVFNFSGKITIILSGTTDQNFATNGPKWITENHGWYLQNLLKPQQ